MHDARGKALFAIALSDMRLMLKMWRGQMQMSVLQLEKEVIGDELNRFYHEHDHGEFGWVPFRVVDILSGASNGKDELFEHR